MATVESILTELKNKGAEKTRKTYSRHGIPLERSFGVSVADLKVIAKTIKGQQALALELYDSGNFEAKYLAGLVASGAKMTTPELHRWAEGADNMPMIAEYTVPWVAVENPRGRELAVQWIGSPKEDVASSGWCTYSGLLATKPDESLDLAEIEQLLNTIGRDVHHALNRVRGAMNGFVIAVGSYVKPLHDRAKATATRIGEVSVDMGDTDCSVRVASASIEKVKASGRLWVKRKMIRC